MEIVENAEKPRGIIGSLIDDPSTVPSTLALQLFSIVPGIAGGLAGFVLASRLANTRRVKTKGVLLASLLNAVLTLGSIYLIVGADEDIEPSDEEDEDEDEAEVTEITDVEVDE
jgi:hypothetical protein